MSNFDSFRLRKERKAKKSKEKQRKAKKSKEKQRRRRKAKKPGQLRSCCHITLQFPSSMAQIRAAQRSHTSTSTTKKPFSFQQACKQRWRPLTVSVYPNHTSSSCCFTECPSAGVVVVVVVVVVVEARRSRSPIDIDWQSDEHSRYWALNSYLANQRSSLNTGKLIFFLLRSEGRKWSKGRRQGTTRSFLSFIHQKHILHKGAVNRKTKMKMEYNYDFIYDVQVEDELMACCCCCCCCCRDFLFGFPEPPQLTTRA